MGIYFEWILFVITVATGIIYFIDQKWFYLKRIELARNEIPGFDQISKKDREEFIKAPLLADYSRSLFMVFLIVFLIRSFLFEPYIVPSGSMLPTIQIDDFIIVNKFAYGIHVPLLGAKIIPISEPKVGDIAVFKDSVNPQISLIKTIVGVPGDRISYINKQLYINDQPVQQILMGTMVEPSNSNIGSVMVNEYHSVIGGKEHDIYTSPAIPPQNFKDLVIPKGEYFAMGDNRDNSDDSRLWGFVPEDNLTGKAAMIIFSWDDATHSIRFNRIGEMLP